MPAERSQNGHTGFRRRAPIDRAVLEEDDAPKPKRHDRPFNDATAKLEDVEKALAQKDVPAAATTLASVVRCSEEAISPALVRGVYERALEIHPKLRRRPQKALSGALDVLAAALAAALGQDERKKLYQLTCEKGLGGTAFKHFRPPPAPPPVPADQAASAAA